MIKRIGYTRFISISADNTGNTRASREGIVRLFPHILNLQDPCHKLSLAIQGICALPAFKPVIVILRGVIKFFGHSTETNNCMEHARIRLGIRRGIIRIGKTRFGSLYHSGESLRLCIPAIRDIVCNPEDPATIGVCTPFILLCQSSLICSHATDMD